MRMSPKNNYNKRFYLKILKMRAHRRIKTGESVTLMALGDVKNELLAHLNRRKDIEIVRMETRYMKKREKGMGLKITVKIRQIKSP
jgi:hypothetical protein